MGKCLKVPADILGNFMQSGGKFEGKGGGRKIAEDSHHPSNKADLAADLWMFVLTLAFYDGPVFKVCFVTASRTG